MKKIFYVMFAVLLISSCSLNNGRANIHLEPLNTVTVEGCEYFIVDAYASYTYVHKGNCKNPIHYENRVVK